MTYDLRFVRCRPGQGWEEAYDEAEDRDPVAPRPEVWQRVVDRVRPLLIDAEETGLECFDRQVWLPLAEASAGRPRGLAMFETVARMLRRNRK